MVLSSLNGIIHNIRGINLLASPTKGSFTNWKQNVGNLEVMFQKVIAIQVLLISDGNLKKHQVSSLLSYTNTK